MATALVDRRDDGFRILSIRPALGRMLTAADDGRNVAVISWTLWTHRSRRPCLEGGTSVQNRVTLLSTDRDFYLVEQAIRTRR